jgi:hypothetical protein
VDVPGDFEPVESAVATSENPAEDLSSRFKKMYEGIELAELNAFNLAGESDGYRQFLCFI